MKVVDQLEELMQNVIESLKDRWDFYRHTAYLKKRGWTEEQYQTYNDPRRNIRATRIKDYYHGYSYFHLFQTSRTDPFTRYPTWIEAYDAIKEWCKNNCRGAWRHDILRVEKDYWEEWEVNEMGRDVLFFAFEDERDFTMFVLRWV